MTFPLASDIQQPENRNSENFLKEDLKIYVFWEVLRFLPAMHRGQNWYLLIATMGGGDHENYNYQWGGGGVIGVLQSLLGGLGNFYCDIIKISPSLPPPRHFNPR